MTPGAYFAYGDLRERALKLSLESYVDLEPETDEILSRASDFYDFLVLAPGEQF